MGLSKAFDSVNRELLWAIMYKKGIPIQLIQMIGMGHENTRLRPKEKGSRKNKTTTMERFVEVR